MLNSLQRYVFGQMAKALTFSTVAIVLVGCSLYSQRYLSDIVERGIPIAVFADLVLYMIPTLLVLVLPITLSGSLIFIYGRLNEDSELTVARACGVSQISLAKPAVALALIATAISYVSAIHLIPQSISTFRDIRDGINIETMDQLLLPQTFNDVQENVTLYFGSRTADGVVEDVLIHDRRDQEKREHDHRPTRVRDRW